MTAKSTETPQFKSVFDGLSAAGLLELCGTPVIIADSDMIVRHLNPAATAMFKDAQSDIKKDLPKFSAAKVVGMSLEDIHADLAEASDAQETRTGSFSLGGRHFGFQCSAMSGEDGGAAGVIIEWQDQTDMQRMLEESKTLISEFENMAIAHDEGKISVYVDRSKFGPDVGNVVDAVNGMVQGHIDTKKKAIAFVSELIEGNYEAELEQFPGEKAFINEGLERVRDALKQNAEDVNGLLTEIRKMVDAHELGDIDVMTDSSRLTGDFADVAQGVNDMVSGHIDTKKKAIAFVTELANGNFEAELEEFPRKKAFINEGMEMVRASFKGVTAEIEMVAQALVDGNFDVDVDSNRYSGSFRTVLETMTAIITNFNGVIDEIERLSNGIVSGNLDTNVDLGSFRGSYGAIMRAFESAFTSLNSAFGTITSQVSQITATVDQMSKASQSLATNSQIQSSSVDEVSSSTEETESQVKSNATAAASARDLVVGASVVAADGKVKIGEMVTAMDGIRASSQDIAKIIKVIDEIAFQTNLLALNAAVEAARAGQHGRGFAVVAQEVRNLAGRSAKAARETSELIESASSRVQEGVRIADETSDAFTSIVDDIEKVRTLVGDIATASDEQSRGVAQINVAVSEIAKSALATSQQADELAASAAQMQAATESMRGEMGRFSLRTMQTAAPSIGSLEGVSPELMAQIQQMLATQGNENAAPSYQSSGGSGLRNSDRDERGFGNF